MSKNRPAVSEDHYMLKTAFNKYKNSNTRLVSPDKIAIKSDSKKD